MIKALSEPKHLSTFRDKYLAVKKGAMALMFLLISVCSFGQNTHVAATGSPSPSALGGNLHHYGRVFNILDYGAKIGNAVNDAVTNSTTTLTSATAAFTQDDVGKIIMVTGANTASATLKTTIASVSNATTIILTAAATSSHTAVQVSYGFDATPGIQAAINAADAVDGGDIYFPHGIYIINGALVTSDNNGNNPNSQIYLPSRNPHTSSLYYGIRLRGEFSRQNLGGGYGVATPSLWQSSGQAILLSTLTSASGTNPSIIGTAPLSGQLFNFQDIDIDFIAVAAYTNSGKAAPILSGFNMQFASKICMNTSSAVVDVVGTATHDASGTEVAGFIISSVNDGGPNTIHNTVAVGYKYGYVLGEHTYIDGIFTYACYIGLTSAGNNYEITGSASIQGTAIGLNMPTAGTIMGMTTGGTKWRILLSYESASQGIWYDPLDVISDANNNARGTIDIVSNAFLTINGGSLAVIREVSGQFPYEKPDGTIHPFGVATNGTSVMTINNASIGTAARMAVRPTNDAGHFAEVSVLGHSYTTSGVLVADAALYGTNFSGAKVIFFNNGGDWVWSTDGGGSAIMQLKTAGNLLLGTAVNNGILTAAGVVAPEANNTRDLGTASFAWRDIYLSHPVGKSAIGVSSSLGTNVSSLTPAGSDTYFSLTVVTSASVSGTVGLIAFGRSWGATPYCVVSSANAATGAMIASAGGYVALNATSVSSMTLAGVFTGAGTWIFNCHCGQ